MGQKLLEADVATLQYPCVIYPIGFGSRDIHAQIQNESSIYRLLSGVLL